MLRERQPISRILDFNVHPPIDPAVIRRQCGRLRRAHQIFSGSLWPATSDPVYWLYGTGAAFVAVDRQREVWIGQLENRWVNDSMVLVLRRSVAGFVIGETAVLDRIYRETAGVRILFKYLPRGTHRFALALVRQDSAGVKDFTLKRGVYWGFDTK